MTSVSFKRSVQVAALTVAFTASGSAMAMAGTHTTSGNNSILGGNQVNAPISVPVNACGNALALLGDAFAGCKGGASVTGGGGGGTWTTSGNNSIGGGNQVNVPVRVPVNVCGNSVAALGDAFAGCKGGASVRGGGHGGTWTTSGNHSIGGGNQVNVPVSVPVNVCGNAVGVLGNAFAGCKGGSHVGPPPGRHHHHMPPPGHHHHHHMPPPGHHHHHHMTPPGHHGGHGQSTTSMSTGGAGGSLPTTGANFVGLLALAGGVMVSGAGCLLMAARRGLLHGVLAATRRAASTVMAR